MTTRILIVRTLTDLGGASPSSQNVLKFKQFFRKIGKLHLHTPSRELVTPSQKNPGSATPGVLMARDKAHFHVNTFEIKTNKQSLVL